MVICIGVGLTLLGPWLPWPGLWAGLGLFFLCPGCGFVVGLCLLVPGCGFFAWFFVWFVPVCGCLVFVYQVFLCSG